MYWILAAVPGLDVRYLQGNYLEELPEGPFDLVTLIMCDFCALSPAQRSALLQRIRGALAPSGHFVFDVYSEAAFAAKEEGNRCAENLLDGFFAPDPYIGVVAHFLYEPERVSLDKYTIVQPSARRVILNWLAHFSPAALRAELEAHGFALLEPVGDLTGAEFDAGSFEFGAVATRA